MTSQWEIDRDDTRDRLRLDLKRVEHGDLTDYAHTYTTTRDT